MKWLLNKEKIMKIPKEVALTLLDACTHYSVYLEDAHQNYNGNTNKKLQRQLIEARRYIRKYSNTGEEFKFWKNKDWKMSSKEIKELYIRKK
jgi:hypothetical protein